MLCLLYAICIWRVTEFLWASLLNESKFLIPFHVLLPLWHASICQSPQFNDTTENSPASIELRIYPTEVCDGGYGPPSLPSRSHLVLCTSVRDRTRTSRFHWFYRRAKLSTAVTRWRSPDSQKVIIATPSKLNNAIIIRPRLTFQRAAAVVLHTLRQTLCY